MHTHTHTHTDMNTHMHTHMHRHTDTLHYCMHVFIVFTLELVAQG